MTESTCLKIEIGLFSSFFNPILHNELWRIDYFSGFLQQQKLLQKYFSIGPDSGGRIMSTSS